MAKKEHRIVSLIASSTETVWALGFGATLAGRSHECDYPPEAQALPVCSEPKFDIDGTSRQIDDRVKNALSDALSVYRVDTEMLARLEPTLIVTQDQCEVCAVSLKDVEEAACGLIGSRPKIVSLAPNTLADVYAGIDRIAAAVDAEAAGDRVVASMRRRIEEVKRCTRGTTTRPSVVCVEWIEPLMAAGNWVPELVEAAGGRELLGSAGEHTPYIGLERLMEADPDFIVVMPCGWGIAKCREEMDAAMTSELWRSLRAAREGRVFLTDGNHYFNRPGPRLAESAEILAEILHPERCAFGHRGSGWVKY